MSEKELDARLAIERKCRKRAWQTLTNHQIDAARRMLGEQVPQRDPRALHNAPMTLGMPLP